MRRLIRHAAAAFGAAAMAVLPAVAEPAGVPSPFVYVRDVAPTIVQDMRYAGAHNFIGRPIDGYEAAECLLTPPAARALAQVEAALRPRGYGLIVWDCYRPARAVRHFVRWTLDPADTRMRGEFYPAVAKSEFIARGYIAAARSAHSRGSAVDLGLRRLDAPPAAPWREADPLVPCTAPTGMRFADGAVDLGTGFDCFDPRARGDAGEVGDAARTNRALLREAMGQQGFLPYAAEWWHFILAREPYPHRSFDIPIRPRKAQP